MMADRSRILPVGIFGLVCTAPNGGWVIRDWAPNATKIFLIGEFNDWQEREEYQLQSIGNGNWELHLDENQLSTDSFTAFPCIGTGEAETGFRPGPTESCRTSIRKIFNAQVWHPAKTFEWKHPKYKRANEAPLIYESHVGMAGEEERVHTYNEFRRTNPAPD